jgi:hypothetical protein
MLFDFSCYGGSSGTGLLFNKKTAMASKAIRGAMAMSSGIVDVN